MKVWQACHHQHPHPHLSLSLTIGLPISNKISLFQILFFFLKSKNHQLLGRQYNLDVEYCVCSPSTGHRLSGIFTQAPAPTLSWFTGRFKQQVYQWTKFSLVRQFTWTWIYWSIFILYRLLTISIVPMKVIPEYFYRNVLEVMLEYNLAN